jgi:iron complex outermembrane recepter protein
MRKSFFLLGVAAAALATSLDAAPAAAQSADSGASANAIAEVVVTARRRAENVQDVPLAVQAFNQEMLEQKGVEEVRDLKYAVPGLTVSPGTFRDSTPSMAIRGFSGQGLQIDQDPSIPFIFNEVPINTPQGQNAAFFDLQSVQVLKGPQGTLQGRNTVGGAVLLTSRRPVLETFGGHISAGAGNYDARTVEAVLNAPLGDRIAVRLAGRRELRDGIWTNIRDGRDYDDKNSWAGRASILMKLTDTVENLTVFDGVQAHTHGSAIVFQAKGFDFNDPTTYPTGGQVIGCSPASTLPNCGGAHNIPIMLTPGLATYLSNDAAYQRSLGWGKFDAFTTAANSRFGRAPFEKILNLGVSNTTTVELGDDLSAKNIIAFRKMNSNLYEDIDGTSRGMSTTAALGNAPIAFLDSQNVVRFQQLTEEFQLQGNNFGGNLNWIGGVFYSRYFGSENSDAAQFAQRFFNVYDVVAKSLGVYGQFDYKLSEQFTLTAGLRYTWDKRRAFYHNQRAVGLFDRSVGLFGEYGNHRVLPAVTNPTVQCNFNRTPTSAHAAFAGVDPRTCAVRKDFKSDAPSYNLTLQYRPIDDVMVYVAHRRGYRAGSLAARATSDEGVFNRDETVRDAEVGLKSQFDVGGMPVRFNAAAYHSWYSNIAVSISRIDPATGLPVNQAENSGRAILYGWEGTLDVKPVEALQLSATYGYVFGKFKSFPGQTVTDALGRPVIVYTFDDLEFGTPRNTFTLGATYTLPLAAESGDVSVSVNYAYTSKRASPGNTVAKGFSVEPSYGIVNARLDWKNVGGRGFDLSVWGNNLADKHYLDGVFAFEDAAGFRSGFPGDPRTYGVTLTWNFGAD